MVRPSLPILLVLIAVATSTPAQSCGTPGTGGLVPKIGLPSNLWDSSGTFDVRDGLPGAPWIWAIDQIPGPYVAPFGNLYAEGGVATTPDGNYLYVALQADSTLRILDAATQNVINTLFLASNGDPDRVYVERRR